MNLIENKTKFTHFGMPSWGIGTYIKTDGTNITIDFENAGTKKFSKTSINTLLKPIKEATENNPTSNSQASAFTILCAPASTQNNTLVQLDGEVGGIAGKNVIESFEGNDSIIFNETYIIIGDHTEALKIHAMYDLTIIGNVTIQECVVNGSITIIGTARIANLTCYNGFMCKGDLYSNKIYVGGDMIVDSIVCDDLICDGNVEIQTTININQSAHIGKTMVACEGIMGAGKFCATNAIANEYFEFDGQFEGKILELGTDNTISNSDPVLATPVTTTDQIIRLANQKLIDEYIKCTSLEEDEIIEYLRNLANIENNALRYLSEIGPLFSKLSDISYQDKLETIDDYLTVVMAEKILPSEVYSYESVEHIGKLFLPNAKKQLVELMFEPTSIEQFAKVLSMTVQFEDELSEEWELLMDKVFESIGLKYSTVSSMISRNTPKKSVEPVLVKPSAGRENEVNLHSEESELNATRMKKMNSFSKELSHT